MSVDIFSISIKWKIYFFISKLLICMSINPNLLWKPFKKCFCKHFRFSFFDHLTHILLKVWKIISPYWTQTDRKAKTDTYFKYFCNFKIHFLGEGSYPRGPGDRGGPDGPGPHHPHPAEEGVHHNWVPPFREICQTQGKLYTVR